MRAYPRVAHGAGRRRSWCGENFPIHARGQRIQLLRSSLDTVELENGRKAAVFRTRKRLSLRHRLCLSHERGRRSHQFVQCSMVVRFGPVLVLSSNMRVHQCGWDWALLECPR